MKELPKYDGDILSKQEEAAAAGEVLCFVGVVDVKNGTGSVELRRYPADHPFASSRAATTSSPSPQSITRPLDP